MKMITNFMIATVLLLWGIIIGVSYKEAYNKGMQKQCDILVEEAFNAGLSGCVD